MKLVHSIVEELGDHTFVLFNHYCFERREVRVDPDKIAIFEDRSSIEKMPEACPFLRFDPAGKAWCTVHQTRPYICRSYCCWRLLILDASGKRAGRVLYQRTFLPDTDALARLWEEVKPTLEGLSNEEWDETLTRTLAASGYRVRR